MKIKTRVKGGSLDYNHNQSTGLSVRSKVKAGEGVWYLNHNQNGRLKVRTNVKIGMGGFYSPNHNQTISGLKVRSQIKAG